VHGLVCLVQDTQKWKDFHVILKNHYIIKRFWPSRWKDAAIMRKTFDIHFASNTSVDEV